MSNNPNQPDDDEQGNDGSPGQGGGGSDNEQGNDSPGQGGDTPPGQGGRHPGRGPPPDSPAWDNAEGVPMQRRRDLMDLPNVVGSGIGPRRSGENKGQPAIIVFVEEKVPDEELDESERVPDTLNGVPTDVVETGRFEAQAAAPGRHERLRPMTGGSSVGLAGTNGWGSSSSLFEDDTGTHVLLTNRHVAAVQDEDSTGTDFLQPGAPHSSSDTPIGTVTELGTWTPGGEATTDSALIDVSTASSNGDVSTTMLGAGDLAGFEAGQVGDRYVNNGARTGLTSAALNTYDTLVSVDYEWTTITFSEVLAFDSFTDKGDSGSLVFRTDPSTGDVYAVGLHFAGSTNSAIAIPIGAVETEHGTLTPVTDSAYSGSQTEISGVAAFFEATPIVQESTSDGFLPVLVANAGGVEGTQTPTLSSGTETIDQGSITLGHADYQIVNFDVSSLSTGETSFTISTDDQTESFTAYVTDTSGGGGGGEEPTSPTTDGILWSGNADWSSATSRSGVVSSAFGDRSGDIVQLGWDPNDPPLSTKGVNYFPLDESTGPAVDAISGDTGTINGPTTEVAGVNRSTAMSFDGVDDQILIDPTSALSSSGSFSIAAIIRPTDLSPAAQTIYRNGAQQDGVAFLSLRGNAIGFGYYGSGGSDNWALDFHSGAFTAGERYFVAGTYSDSSDGGSDVLQAWVGTESEAQSVSASYPGRATGHTAFIGHQDVYGDRPFVGDIEEVLVCDDYLFNSEIGELQNALRSGSISLGSKTLTSSD